ncbi:MerR family transcriptional regulator [Clostridium ganghwense]|uniref:MerR family transcriptional regulator n=1 Tax=Clostridium ganghwense TaxID=312089 RepID=A0ABT4CLZ7_9CLOT|nr:MerR family transcriptional regulator [Clostridium ganghwense]MCY6370075.1 MerR family transcriptional regulator [Clostridium ganghwense]
MNIKIASEKTGLTKKAIKYYENEGLIYPSKNLENNYRKYTEDDIVKLNLIGALRAIDIPVSDIKNVVEGKKNISEVMKEALDRINKNIDNLEKSKLIINTLMEKDSKDYKSVGKQVKRLKETLELSIDEKKEYISNTLLRIFPGDFGKLFVTNYEPFLKVTVDSDEKKEAWLKLVEFLDDLSELDENHPFIKQLNNNNNNNMDSYRKRQLDKTKILLSGNIDTKEEFKKQILSFISNLQENELLRKTFKENMDKSQDMCNTIGINNGSFDNYLSILNEDYKKYREIVEEINKDVDKEVKNKTGLTFKEFMQNL